MCEAAGWYGHGGLVRVRCIPFSKLFLLTAGALAGADKRDLDGERKKNIKLLNKSYYTIILMGDLGSVN